MKREGLLQIIFVCSGIASHLESAKWTIRHNPKPFVSGTNQGFDHHQLTTCSNPIYIKYILIIRENES